MFERRVPKRFGSRRPPRAALLFCAGPLSALIVRKCKKCEGKRSLSFNPESLYARVYDITLYYYYKGGNLPNIGPLSRANDSARLSGRFEKISFERSHHFPKFSVCNLTTVSRKIIAIKQKCSAPNKTV